VSKKAIVIGSGYAGLSAATFLAQSGWEVQVLEKHDQPGGRSRFFSSNGFSFDMGPSWYWMPDVFERYFTSFGRKVEDYYTLERLSPSYRIYWADDYMDVPSDYEELKKLFNQLETGAGEKLDAFMEEAAYKYKVGVNKLVYKPSLSWTEFIDKDLMTGIFRLDVFNNIKSHIAKFFKHPKIRQLMEFPVLFLGALPENTPALYSLMNYADIKLGTWYPKGGMHRVVAGMHQLATEKGVVFHFNKNVNHIHVTGKNAHTVETSDGEIYKADVVVGAADYHFMESSLLEEKYQSYSKKYWNSRLMAPGSLIYYLGVNKKVDGILHHTLFFDVPFDQHGKDIYTDPKWPDTPLFYLSSTSISDASQAPEGCDNLFFLIPIAAGLDGDDEQVREKYLDLICKRFKEKTGYDIKEHLVFKRTYCSTEFIQDYNAFKGNAYGLANTLLQTAILRPSCKSKKVDNLYYTGQLTVPGPGVPPSLISGEVVAKLIDKEFNRV
jgi:phytoene desaturase